MAGIGWREDLRVVCCLCMSSGRVNCWVLSALSIVECLEACLCGVGCVDKQFVLIK